MKKILSWMLLALSLAGFEKVYGQCSGCSDFTSVLTASQRKALAVQFAPQLRFDDGADTYPNYANAIFAASTNNTDCSTSSQLSQTVADDYSAESSFSSASSHIVTYYIVQNSGTRYFIDYWWTYYRQPNCIGATGGHDYDWEHVLVQVNLESGTYKKVSVTYFQHSGWYTRTFNSSYLTIVDTDHPVSYVGRKAHGNYHFGASCSSLTYCLYYGDCRNTSSARYVNVWSSGLLKEITCSDVWSAWPGQWGGTGQGPLYKIPAKFPNGYVNAAACYSDGSSQTNYSSSVVLGSISSQKSALVTEDTIKERASALAIFPNPVNSTLNIEGVDANTQIDIYNQTGMLVKSLKGETSIRVEGLASGLYIVKTSDGQTFKFTKN